MVKLRRIDQLPKGADNHCPISMEKFDYVDPDFLGGATYVPEDPRVCVVTLPCGHHFTALCISYYMTLNDMRCPSCRAGHKNKMRVACLPRHVRKIVAAAVAESLKKVPHCFMVLYLLKHCRHGHGVRMHRRAY